MASFRKATKKQSRLRAALDGPAGAGKTFTALRFATALGKKIAVINTESGAVEKYLGDAPDGVPFDFDIVDPTDHSPTTYTQHIQEAGRLGYDVLIIDSLSHAWAGQGGALELVDKQGGNSFTAWKKVTPMHNQLIEAILKSPCHVICTMRSKMEYIMEEQINPQTGAKKSVPKKIGMAPIQRQGMEYEFDLVCDIDDTHTMTVSKSRCPLVDGAVVFKPGAAFIEPVRAWLTDGVEVPASYWAVNPEDLLSSKEIAREATDEAAKAQAAAARRQQLLAAANVGGASVTEQPVEPAPFDGGMPVPGETPAVAAAVAPTPVAQPVVTATSAAPGTVATEPVATIQQLQELMTLAQQIGRSAAEVNEQCKARFGVPATQLPQSKMTTVIAAFRRTVEMAKNQSAA